MGKIEYFTIVLQEENPIYFSNETLIGQVNLRVKERLKINCVKILVNGYARVHWTEQHSTGSGKNRRTRTVSYDAREDYLNFNVVFIAKQGDNDLYLEAGDYSYPFQIVLPPNLPTSFEHYIGQIRYSIKGTIDIPWAFDKHTVRTFSIVNHVDLNLNPSLAQSYALSDTKVVCCWCCKSDPIVAKFSIMKTGFVPGEGIVFNVTIDNQSSREIKPMSVSLYQRMKFYARGKSKSDSRKIAEIFFPNRIGPKSSETWNNSVLTIPPICPSSSSTCRIIVAYYEVVFNFDPSGMATSKDLTIPIVIGSIPLRVNEISMQMPMPPMSYEMSMFEPSAPQLPSESKGETIESDESTYRPFYPFYKDLNKQ